MAKALFSVGGSSGLVWQDFLDICKACDEFGYHGFYPSDHLMAINPGRGTTDQRLEGLTVMAAMSGHTKRLRLGMLVVNNNFRHPVITAKMVNTIDHASGGRAELGIGSGNVKHEFEVHGIHWPPFKERIARLDESLTVIRTLWTEEPATFQGKYYQINEAPMMPKPVQKPYPPITIGGRGESSMRLAAKHANDYNQIAPLLDVKAGLDRFKAICGEAGKDYNSFRRSVQIQVKLSDNKDEVEQAVARAAANPHGTSERYPNQVAQARDGMLWGDAEQIKEQVSQWTAAGVTHFILMTPRPFDRGMMERFARDVAPAFS